MRYKDLFLSPVFVAAWVMGLVCSFGIVPAAAQAQFSDPTGGAIYYCGGSLTGFQHQLVNPPLPQPLILSEIAKLTSSDGAPDDTFGMALATSGDTLVVGAPYATVNGNVGVGAAYVFTKPTDGSTGLAQTAKLYASDGVPGADFGLAVSISGNTIVVESGFGGAPSVYVFVEPPGGWQDMTETAKLTSFSSYSGGGVLPSIATDGNTVFLGVPWSNYKGNNFVGITYVYVKPVDGEWISMGPSARLVASDNRGDGRFGSSVVLSGENVWICGSGRAYLFRTPPNGWSGTRHEVAQLMASNGDGFSTLAVNGTTVVAGAPGATISGYRWEQGAVYVFVKPQTGWKTMTQTAKLTVSDGQIDDSLGFSVALSGGKIIASAPGRAFHRGAIYGFSKPETGWQSTSDYNLRLKATDGVAGDFFGWSLSFASDTLFVGTPFAQIGSNPFQGAVYEFGKQ